VAALGYGGSMCACIFIRPIALLVNALEHPYAIFN
jgi:hypothetical protein